MGDGSRQVGGGKMTLEVTKIEYLRLRNHVVISEKQRRGAVKITPAKEAEIIAAIQADISFHEIQRTLRASNKTIINIRKKHGLWGA